MTQSVEAIAQRLVALLREGKFEEAQRELFAEDAQNVEPEGMPPGMESASGLPAIIEKGRRFQSMVEQMHGIEVSEPVVAANWFSVACRLDATMQGRGRVQMDEICVYRVREGKIVREEFFFDVG